MNKQFKDYEPFPLWERPGLSAYVDSNDFDPLGSYTGKVKEHGEHPVQDADDL